MTHQTAPTDLRIAVVEGDDIEYLIQSLQQARGRVRIGIDIDGIKVDPGHCWGPGIGRLANEAGR